MSIPTRKRYTLTEDELVAKACEIAQDKCRVADGPLLLDPEAAAKVFMLRLAGHKREVFACLFLDTRLRMVTYEELFAGTIDGAEVHPRVVVQRALHHNAAAVVCAHNHPSGDTEPSASDRAVTARLKQALALVDVRLLDHFVVGSGPPVSMASKGFV